MVQVRDIEPTEKVQKGGVVKTPLFGFLLVIDFFAWRGIMLVEN